MQESKYLEFSPTDSRDEMDFIFSNYFNRKMSFPAQSGWRPTADLFDTEDEVVIAVDLSGVNRDTIKMVLEQNEFRIRGIRDDIEGFCKRNYQLMEINYGPFERVFELPCRVEGDSVNVTYKDGILLIRMTKKQPEPLSTVTIEIRSDV